MTHKASNADRDGTLQQRWNAVWTRHRRSLTNPLIQYPRLHDRLWIT